MGVKAIYENKVLKPLEKLDLEDGEVVDRDQERCRRPAGWPRQDLPQGLARRGGRKPGAGADLISVDIDEASDIFIDKYNLTEDEPDV